MWAFTFLEKSTHFLCCLLRLLLLRDGSTRQIRFWASNQFFILSKARILVSPFSFNFLRLTLSCGITPPPWARDVSYEVFLPHSHSFLLRFRPFELSASAPVHPTNSRWACKRHAQSTRPLWFIPAATWTHLTRVLMTISLHCDIGFDESTLECLKVVPIKRGLSDDETFILKLRAFFLRYEMCRLSVQAISKVYWNWNCSEFTKGETKPSDTINVAAPRDKSRMRSIHNQYRMAFDKITKKKSTQISQIRECTGDTISLGKLRDMNNTLS